MNNDGKKYFIKIKGVLVEVTDENGFVKKGEKEKQVDFVKRLMEVSSEFKKVISVTDWVNKEIMITT